jgi:hypothetical protein
VCRVHSKTSYTNGRRDRRITFRCALLHVLYTNSEITWKLYIFCSMLVGLLLHNFAFSFTAPPIPNRCVIRPVTRCHLQSLFFVLSSPRRCHLSSSGLLFVHLHKRHNGELMIVNSLKWSLFGRLRYDNHYIQKETSLVFTSWFHNGRADYSACLACEKGTNFMDHIDHLILNLLEIFSWITVIYILGKETNHLARCFNKQEPSNPHEIGSSY